MHRTGRSSTLYMNRAIIAGLLLGQSVAFVAPSVRPLQSPILPATQVFSSIAMDPPSPRNSIGERMQQMVGNRREKETAESINAKDGPTLPNIFHAGSKDECLKLIDTSMSRLTVFKFYSSFCRACKRIAPRFEKLARENPEIDFVFVQLTDNNKKFIVGELGIPALPYGGIYHPEVGLVETMSVTSKRFTDFEAIFGSYRDLECQLPYHDEQDENLLFLDPYRR